MSVISTQFLLPTAITSTNTGATTWINPQNLLLKDSEFATAAGVSQTVTVGNFNHSLPATATVLNVTLRVTGYRGATAVNLQLFAVDDTSGVTMSYPYMPVFIGLTGTNSTFTLAPTLFATTVDYLFANNIKITALTDAETHLDCIEVQITYDDGLTPAPAPIITGELVCSEFVQAQPFTLARAMTAADLYCFTTSFNYPNSTGTGAPIVIGDFYGDAMITIDQGKPKEENCRLETIEHDYQGTGLVRLGFGSLANRGLNFKYPYTSDVTKIYPHTGTAELVISNSAPFYDRFLKKCQIDALVSAPIEVLDESVSLTPAAHSLNFTGGGVVATAVGQDVTINIPGAGVTPPVVVSVSSSTNFNVQTPTLTWVHTSSGLNRLLLVQVSTEESKTVTGVTFNGVPLTQEVSNTDVPNNLRSEIWSLVAPPVGTFNIVATMSAAAFISAGAESYVTVDQTTPIGNTQTGAGNSNTPSLVITTANNNSLAADSLTTAQTPIVYTVGAGQTLNWRHTANNVTRQGGSSVEGAGMAPDNVTLDYSITQITDWVMTAIEVNGITSTLATLAVLDEGATIDPSVAFMDFVGPGVVATQTSPGNVQVTISGATSNIGFTVTQIAHGLSLGDVIKSNGVDNQFTTAQADTEANSEAVGIVTNVINANTFEYVSAASQLNGAYVPVGAPGTSIWLDPTVAGGITATEPSTIGQIKRGLGTIIASGATMYFDIAALAEKINPPATGGAAIGGPITGGTDGSVLFVNPAGILAEDNPNFYYDNVNNRWGFGTNTPSRQVVINGLGLLTDQVTRWEYAGNPVTTIINDGTQNWFLNGVGRISYSTPNSNPGLSFLTLTSLERSDFSHQSGGGFNWNCHALGTLPPTRMRMSANGELLIKSSIGIGVVATERLDVDGNITTRAQGEMIWQDAAGGQFVSFRAPAVVSSSVTYDLPPADGTAGQQLTTNGAGVLTWASSGASTNSYYTQVALPVGTTTITHSFGLGTPKAIGIFITDDATGTTVAATFSNYLANSFDITMTGAVALANVFVNK